MTVATTEETRFPVMGTSAHVIVVGGPPGGAARARRRIEELDRLWSRFRPDSELSRLNAAAGRPFRVGPETLMLVRRGIRGWSQTGGRFDPTLLGAVVRAGYDRDFGLVRTGPAGPAGAPGPSGPAGALGALIPNCAGIVVRGEEVTLPAGTGFDSGGLGKGLAADIVAREAIRAGAEGACINLGGDLRVIGVGAQGPGWTLSVEHPGRAEPLVRIGLSDGGLATSTTLVRRWRTVGGERHHLIDPATGESYGGPVVLAAVVSAEGWLSEVLVKRVLLSGAEEDPFAGLRGTGAEALVVTADGSVSFSPGLDRYLGARRPRWTAA